MHRASMYISVFLALLLCACGPFVTDAEVPATGAPNSTFPVSVFLELTSDHGQAYGGTAVQIPNGWDADQVEFFGPDSGQMVYSTSYTSELDFSFPSPPGYKWCGFETEETFPVEGEEQFTVVMTIYTDDLLGTIELSFHSAFAEAGSSWSWEDEPIGGFFVDIIESALEQQTWAEIKTSFD